MALQTVFFCNHEASPVKLDAIVRLDRGSGMSHGKVKYNTM